MKNLLDSVILFKASSAAMNGISKAIRGHMNKIPKAEGVDNFGKFQICWQRHLSLRTPAALGKTKQII